MERNINWDEVEQYLKQYVGEFIEIAESKERQKQMRHKGFQR